MIHVSIHALLIDSDTYTDSKKKQHHSINDRLSNNQICIMFENSKKFDRSNIINQLIKPTESNCARYHDVNSMLSDIPSVI